MDNSYIMNYNNPYIMNYPYGTYAYNYLKSAQYQQPTGSTTVTNTTEFIPISLSKSMEGKYFVGVAEDLTFGEARNTWARLYNPIDSGVNLFVNVWTVSNVTLIPYKAQMWFNGNPSGIIQESNFVTCTNTTINPVPKPKVKLQFALSTKGFPEGGVLAFGRTALSGTTITDEEDGKFIFPPGGSFLIMLSNPVNPTEPAIGQIAFGWWEEPIQ